MDLLDYLIKYLMFKQKATSEMEGILRVGTLNFSGINTNPFQYDDGSEVIKSLNQNFNLIKDAEMKKFDGWKGSKLDKDYKSNRMTISGQDKFILHQGKLPNYQQFRSIWIKKYNTQKNEGKISYKASEQEQQDVIKMDYVFYKAAAMYVYKIQSIPSFESQIKQQDPSILLDFLKSQKEKPACSLSQKRKLVEEYYKNLQVIFLQQASSVDWKQNLPVEYAFSRYQDSIIIYDRILGDIDEQMTNKYAKDFNAINQDTVAIFTTKKYLLISSHLTSKDEHKNQIKKLFLLLERILDIHKEYKLILGIDANHYLADLYFKQPKVLPGHDIYPFSNENPTSVKRRTYLQAQYNKANVSVSEVKDHIITNLKITKSRIQMINGEESQGKALPNNIHPYDHFVVRVDLKI